MKNCFPCDIIQRVVNNYLYKFFNHDNLLRDGQTKKDSTLFFKLPFIGPFSRATQRMRRIKVISKKYCKDLDIRLVFTSYKLKNMFVVKDAVPPFTAFPCGLQIFMRRRSRLLCRRDRQKFFHKGSGTLIFRS